MRVPPEAAALPPRLIDAAQVLPDRYAMLRLLPKRGVFVEVGVGTGDFSAQILRVCEPRRFVAIDEFTLHTLPSLWGKPPAEHFGDLCHRAAYEARFAAEIAAGAVQVIEGDSAACLEQLADGSADIVYIDANHYYEPVRRDLAAARRKVRPDGWIVMNDYVMVAELGADTPYGVVHATNEFMLEHDWAWQYLALQPRMYCDVALRPAHLVQSAGAESVAENARLRAAIAALLASKSWRLTAPLRAMARLAGRRPVAPF